MTARELREATQFLIHQAAPSIPSNAPINAYIYDAMVSASLATMNPALRDLDDAQNYGPSTTNYFPSDLLVPLSVEVLESSSDDTWHRLDRMTREKAVSITDWEDNALTGSPTGFYEDGVETTAGANRGKLKIKLFPTPSSSVTSGLRVAYLRKPTKIQDFTNDTDEVIDFPDFFHLAIAYHAAWLFLSRQSAKAQKDFAGYEVFYKERLDELARWFKEDTRADSHGYQVGVHWGGPTEPGWSR